MSSFTPTDSAAPYSCQLQVRWADFDQLRHVNNVKYIEYAQEARVMFFREKFSSTGKNPPALVVRRTEIDFLRPLLADSNTITVEVTITAVGRTSFTMRHTMFDGNRQVSCVLDAVMVAFDAVSNTSLELEEDARIMLQAHAHPQIDSSG